MLVGEKRGSVVYVQRVSYSNDNDKCDFTTMMLLRFNVCMYGMDTILSSKSLRTIAGLLNLDSGIGEPVYFTDFDV